MPLPTPNLPTARLLLRPFAESDAEAIYTLQSNARVLRYWDSPPWTDRVRAQTFLAACRQMEEDGSGARFAIESIETRAFVGWCAMFRWNPVYRSLGIGYCLDEPAWGKGYATEAVRAMLHWAYETLDLNRVEAELDTRNAASARVLERLGFQREGLRREDCVVAGEVSDSYIYGLLKRDWNADAPAQREPRSLRIALLQPADAQQYRALMLEAYELAADAFTSTAEERAAEPASYWVKRIADPSGLSAAFGAFDGQKLVGTVALEFSAKPKTRHKALVIGMYVAPAARGAGAGRALLGAAVAFARAREGVLRLTLTVTEGNASAIKLYSAAGFQAFGVEPMAIFTPSGFKGKVHMGLSLSAALTGGLAR